MRWGFEGGQTPLLRRQPKLPGFRPPHSVQFEVVNIGWLESMLPEGTYTVEDLEKRRVAHGKFPLKILGQGHLTKKFTLSVPAASKRARAEVVGAGGRVIIVPFKVKE